VHCLFLSNGKRWVFSGLKTGLHGCNFNVASEGTLYVYPFTFILQWAFHYAKDSKNFGRNSNGKVRFGFFRPEWYSGSPLEVVLSPPQRLKGFFFSGGVDPLSNVSAGNGGKRGSLIDPFDFAPVVHFAQRIDITNAWTSAEERGGGPLISVGIF